MELLVGIGNALIAKLYTKSKYGNLTSGMAVYHEGVFWVKGYEKEKLYEDRYRSNASSVRGFTMDVTFSLCFWCTRGVLFILWEAGPSLKINSGRNQLLIDIRK